VKYLIYNHPAVPPNGIKIGMVYSLEELEKKFTLDEIKCLFKPDNFKWDETVKVDIKK